MSRSRLPVLLLGVLAALPSAAREVYKCTSPGGAVSFQDAPCGGGAHGELLHLADFAPVAAAAPPPVEEPPPVEKPAKPAPPHPPRERKPLPTLWLCTNAEDGKQYVSRSVPAPRAVPMGALGFTTKSLAEAYSGGKGMSAPELNRATIDNSPAASAGAGYIMVQDRCAAASHDETCTYLRNQRDEARDKEDSARFKDEQQKMQTQAEQLGEELDGC